MRQRFRHVLLRSREQRLWPGLLLGGAALAIALILGKILSAAGTGDRFYVLLIVPVLLAAWTSGITAGLIITVVGMLLLETLIPSQYTAHFHEPFDVLPTVTFLLSGMLVSLFAGRVRQAALDAVQAQRDVSKQQATILEQLAESVVVADQTGRLVSLNAAARRFYGMMADQIADSTWDTRPHLYRLDGTLLTSKENPLYRATHGEAVSAVRLRVRFNDGTSRIIETGARALINSAGDTIGGVASFRDVTEEIEQQEQLAENEAFLQAILDTIDEAIVVCDADENLTLFNRAAEDLLGPMQQIPSEEWMGIYGTFDPDSGQLISNDELPLIRAARGQEVRDHPLIIKRPGIEPRLVLWSGKPYLDKNGNVLGATVSGRDITALHEAEKERALFLEMSEDLISEGSFKGVWTRMNPAWTREMGWPTDSLIGHDFFEIIHPDDHEMAHAELDQLFQGQKASNFEMRMLHADGSWRWLSWNVTPDTDRSRLFGVARDVTEQHQQQQRLAQTLTELQRSNAELQNFAYVASHDLQEPLRKIRAFGDRLRSKLGDGNGSAIDDQSSDYLNRMQNAARRMSTLIEDLLSFSRVTTQANPLEPTDLSAVLDGVVEDLQDAIERSGATLDIQPGLPTIHSEASQIRQVLQNLLTNALKFRHPDIPPRIEIRWRTLAAGEGTDPAPTDTAPTGTAPTDTDGASALPEVEQPTLEIRVRDNGIGIEPRHADRIFAIFQRLHGRDEYEGTGIGLAVVRKIAQRHGGEIYLRSEIGTGSTFILRLPIHQPV